MSKQVLIRALIGILDSIEQTRDIANEEEMVNDLVTHLMNEKTNKLTHFGNYLEEQCDLKPNTTLILAQKLMR